MNSFRTPLISVVMPVYNAERYLREAVDSILEQSFTDFELIVVDDGSTDSSLEILREYEQNDSRVRVVCNEGNSGLTLSLNKGVELARGELIARMDGDDISDRNRFKKQVAYMNQHPRCVAVSGNVEFIDAEGVVFGRSDNPLEHDGIEEKLWQGLGSSLVHAAVMLKKDAVVMAREYRVDAGQSEDLDLYLRLGEVGELANLEDILFKVRRHYQSISAIAKKKKKYSRQTTLSQARDYVRHSKKASVFATLRRDRQNTQGKEEGQERRMMVLREAAERRGMDGDNIELFDFLMPETRGEWHADIAWRAYKQGYEKAARKHSRLAVRYGMCEYAAWRAFVYLGTGIGRTVLKRIKSIG